MSEGNRSGGRAARLAGEIKDALTGRADDPEAGTRDRRREGAAPADGGVPGRNEPARHDPYGAEPGAAGPGGDPRFDPPGGHPPAGHPGAPPPQGAGPAQGGQGRPSAQGTPPAPAAPPPDAPERRSPGGTTTESLPDGGHTATGPGTAAPAGTAPAGGPGPDGAPGAGGPAGGAPPPADPQGEHPGLIPPDRARGYQDRWDALKGDFVDEPRSAVRSANALVGDVLDEVEATFRRQREHLERDLDGQDASTEDLRLALNRYRSFFERLLSM